MRTVVRLSTILLLGAGFLIPQDKPALSGLDPVLLIRGQETPGKPELEGRHAGFLYHFASVETQQAFRREPDRFGIQYEGSCGKMGTGSGKGSPERYWVHDGRIYVFASESCRNGFKGDPENFVEKPETAPPAGADSKRRGRELVEKAVAAHGGRDRIDGQRSYVEQSVTDAAGERQPSLRVSLHARLPGHYRRGTDYPNYGAYGEVVTPSEAATFGPKTRTPTGPLTRAVLQRGFERTPLEVLRARHRKDFQAWAVGETAFGVYFDGMVMNVELDPANSRVARMSHRGRAPGGKLGNLVVHFEDYRAVDGIWIAHRVRSEHNGAAAGAHTVKAFDVNGPVDSGLFEATAKP